MLSFEDILNRPMEDLTAPKPLPVGEYLGIIEKYEITQRGKNQNHCVVFTIRLAQALNQDPSFQRDLIEALDGKPLSDKKLPYVLWLTEDSAFRLRIFLVDHLGIEGMTKVTEALASTGGKELIVSISH